MTLATKYRPDNFDDLTEQDSIITILSNQIEHKSFQHAYLFTGPAGTGKTTTARIFSRMINNNDRKIEIDAASNSGVDNIRNVISQAQLKPIDADYKVFIIDECHSLSSGAWQALLKLLEEPPLHSIFILCTTNAEKIPDTILSRVQRFQFNKISNKGIKKRLLKILKLENIKDYDLDGLDFITKMADGGMRSAISMLDKCLAYSNNLSLDNILKALGTENYETYFKLLSLLLGNTDYAIKVIDNLYNDGKDLKIFLKEFSKFLLEIAKYHIYQSMEYITIPITYEDKISKCKSDKFYDLIDFIVDLNNNIKYENDVRTMIELYILGWCRNDRTTVQ